MKVHWKTIRHFDDYSISDTGLVRSEKSGKILSPFVNQSGLVCIGMMRNGQQYHRSVPLLVAQAFLSRHRIPGRYTTPINLDGDRHNNEVSNLAWRPRWFAVKYNRQFIHPYDNPITHPIYDLKTGDVFPNSFECAVRFGLLEEDLVMSILNRTYCWPTYQEFAILIN